MSDNAPTSTPTPAATPTSAPSAADARVAALEKKLTEIEAAMAFSGKMRRFLLLGVLALVSVIGYSLWKVVDDVRSPEFLERMQAAAQKHLEKNQQIYRNELELLVSEVQPKLTEAFMSQAKKDTPEYTKAIDRERDLLAENLEIQFTALVNKQYEDTLAKSEQIIIREFPKAEDEEIRRKLMANMDLAMKKVAKEFQVDFFKEELNKLYEVWDTFPVAAAPDEGDPPLEDQLVYMLLDWFKMKLSSQDAGLLAVEPAATN